jgi:hypothetical protein
VPARVPPPSTCFSPADDRFVERTWVEIGAQMKRPIARAMAGVFVCLTLVCACSEPSRRADAIAHTARLQKSRVQGFEFDHIVYASASLTRTPVLVFIDGDGTPWEDGGRRVSSDPTPHRPLALDLAVHTPGSVVYLGRPCFFGNAHAPGCVPELWTSERYSERVVRSLTTALNRFVGDRQQPDVVLIGYSGGGTLAVLMAPRVRSLRAVITIGANLDVAAWAALHGYLPLKGSLNPADSAPLAASTLQIHLTGARDSNVPLAAMQRYLAANPASERWMFPNFDHVCCWVKAWPELLARIKARVAAAGAPNG